MSAKDAYSLLRALFEQYVLIYDDFGISPYSKTGFLVSVLIANKSMIPNGQVKVAGVSQFAAMLEVSQIEVAPPKLPSEN